MRENTMTKTMKISQIIQKLWTIYSEKNAFQMNDVFDKSTMLIHLQTNSLSKCLFVKPNKEEQKKE
jgi:hypothetical protein